MNHWSWVWRLGSQTPTPVYTKLPKHRHNVSNQLPALSTTPSLSVVMSPITVDLRIALEVETKITLFSLKWLYHSSVKVAKTNVKKAARKATLF